MVNSAHPDEGGGGARPHPFTLSTITSKVVVYAPLLLRGQIHSYVSFTLFFSVILHIKLKKPPILYVNKQASPAVLLNVRFRERI